MSAVSVSITDSNKFRNLQGHTQILRNNNEDCFSILNIRNINPEKHCEGFKLL